MWAPQGEAQNKIRQLQTTLLSQSRAARPAWLAAQYSLCKNAGPMKGTDSKAWPTESLSQLKSPFLLTSPFVAYKSARIKNWRATSLTPISFMIDSLQCRVSCFLHHPRGFQLPPKTVFDNALNIGGPQFVKSHVVVHMPPYLWLEPYFWQSPHREAAPDWRCLNGNPVVYEIRTFAHTRPPWLTYTTSGSEVGFDPMKFLLEASATL
eukprot:1143051-Pelagomonas_calceolata.AAC.3